MTESHLSSFPDMPFLTYRTTNRLHKYAPDATFHLELEPDRDRVTTDAQVYIAYIDDRPVGRFTIRRTGWQMERVYFCKLPNPPNVPAAAVHEFSAAGTVLEDAVRIGWETLRLWLYYLSGRSRKLWKYSPWQELNYERGRGGRRSVLGMMATFPEVTVRHDFCELDGNPFAAVNFDIMTHGSTDYLDLDIGGYCVECDKNVCPEHLAFATVVESEANVEVVRIVCAQHQAVLRFRRPPVADDDLKKLEILAKYLAGLMQPRNDEERSR
jgi:hypothetical protein